MTQKCADPLSAGSGGPVPSADRGVGAAAGHLLPADRGETQGQQQPADPRGQPAA